MSHLHLDHGLFWTLDHYIAFVEALPGEWPGALDKSGLTAQDLRIWLADKRDGLSLADIARREYPRYWKEGKGRKHNQAPLSLVRRAIDRVERFLNRDGDEFVYSKRSRGIQLETPVFFPSYELASLPLPEDDATAKGQQRKLPKRGSAKANNAKAKGSPRDKSADE
jgi:hypothetical protein